MEYEFELTDGSEVFARLEMTIEEAEQANAVAREATDGNLYWVSEAN